MLKNLSTFFCSLIVIGWRRQVGGATWRAPNDSIFFPLAIKTCTRIDRHLSYFYVYFISSFLVFQDGPDWRCPGHGVKRRAGCFEHLFRRNEKLIIEFFRTTETLIDVSWNELKYSTDLITNFIVPSGLMWLAVVHQLPWRCFDSAICHWRDVAGRLKVIKGKAECFDWTA